MKDLGQSVFRPLSTEVVAYTGTAGSGTALANGVKAVRVVCTTAAFVAIGKTAVATVNDMPVAAGAVEIFRVDSGDRVSAIQSASGGNVHITSLV